MRRCGSQDNMVKNFRLIEETFQIRHYDTMCTRDVICRTKRVDLKSIRVYFDFILTVVSISHFISCLSQIITFKDNRKRRAQSVLLSIDC